MSDAILAGYRESIDNIDAALVHILAERFRSTNEIGVLKAQFSLPAVDKEREERQHVRLKELSRSAGLDPTLALPNSDADLDPFTGLPTDQTFQTPAEIAMFCLSDAADWIQIHDCISRYDPSTRFTGGF